MLEKYAVLHSQLQTYGSRSQGGVWIILQYATAFRLPVLVQTAC